MERTQYKLKDICNIQYGYAFDSKKFSDNPNNIALIRIRDVKTGKSHTYYSGDYDNTYIVNAGDILIGMDGEFNIAKWKSEPALLNQRVCKIIPNKEVNADYLQYYLSIELKNIEARTAFVTVKHLSAKELNALKLEIHSLKKQVEIAQKLKCIEKLMDEEQEQINKYDTLIKSKFVEMFGDLMLNSKQWKEVNISEVINGKISNGFFAKRDAYIDEGNVSVLGVAYVVNRMYSQCMGLPKTYGTEKDIEKFQVRYGDLLFCRSSLVAEGIGKASIVPKNVPCNTLFECHVIRLPLDLKKCVPEYMQMLTTTEYYRNQILTHSKTATMTTIGQDGILKTNILLPPLELQKQFLQFIEQVNKLKATQQKNLEKAQLLFDSLMQQYFG